MSSSTSSTASTTGTNTSTINSNTSSAKMTQQPSNHRLFNRYTATGVDNTVGFMLCGAVSGTVSRTCAAPFERLKILFQVQDLGYARDSIDKDMIRGKRYTGIVSGM
jgi:hypothetical protein